MQIVCALVKKSATCLQRPVQRWFLFFIVLTIVTLELAVVSLILTRSLGDEGLLMSQNLVARQAADTPVEG